ncbi:MAG TPA: VOC family protein [Thermoanaerobaculia bacterium]|nr:VOC family protein [Thermoanaerobaculia bacterium]
MKLFQGINVVSLSVPDLDAAREFYGQVLGLGAPLYDMPEIGWVEFSGGAAAGNIAVTTNEPAQPPSTRTTVVFNTRDCYESCAELRRRGVQCEEPVAVPGVITYCTFYDPFGNRLQMCSDPPED